MLQLRTFRCHGRWPDLSLVRYEVSNGRMLLTRSLVQNHQSLNQYQYTPLSLQSFGVDHRGHPAHGGHPTYDANALAWIVARRQDRLHPVAGEGLSELLPKPQLQIQVRHAAQLLNLEVLVVEFDDVDGIVLGFALLVRFDGEFGHAHRLEVSAHGWGSPPFVEYPRPVHGAQISPRRDRLCHGGFVFSSTIMALAACLFSWLAQEQRVRCAVLCCAVLGRTV